MVAQKKKAKAAKPRATSTKKTTKTRKLPSFFSFRNKQFVVLLVIVIGMAGFGSYQIYKNSVAAAFKSPGSLSWCQANSVTLRQGSSGECVRNLRRFLNDYRRVYGEQNRMFNHTVEPYFDDVTKWNVVVFQQRWGYLLGNADGIVGPRTYGVIRTICDNVLRHRNSEAPNAEQYCGI